MSYKLLTPLLLSLVFVFNAGAQTKETPPAQRHLSSPEDAKAIEAVIQNFQTALKSKDVKLLSSLMFNSNILFASPVKPALIQKIKGDMDVNFDGLSAGGYRSFAQFIAASKDQIEEKFYNVKIMQDDNFAVVLFDFEFIENEVVENYGVECWQMMKLDSGWKIFSVNWSTRGTLK
jgi:hypothetical protein